MLVQCIVSCKHNDIRLSPHPKESLRLLFLWRVPGYEHRVTNDLEAGM